MTTKATLPPLFIRTNRHTSTDGHAWGWLDTAPPGSSKRMFDDLGLRIEWSGSKGLASAAHIVRCAYCHDDLVTALRSAKLQIVTLGGDARGYEGGDAIQAAVLTQIDAALAKAQP